MEKAWPLEQQPGQMNRLRMSPSTGLIVKLLDQRFPHMVLGVAEVEGAGD